MLIDAFLNRIIGLILLLIDISAIDELGFQLFMILLAIIRLLQVKFDWLWLIVQLLPTLLTDLLKQCLSWLSYYSILKLGCLVFLHHLIDYITLAFFTFNFRIRHKAVVH